MRLSILLIALILPGCSLIARPVAPIGMNTQNCDPSKQDDCWSVSHKQLRTLFDRLEQMEAELATLTEAYTFCKDGI